MTTRFVGIGIGILHNIFNRGMHLTRSLQYNLSIVGVDIKVCLGVCTGKIRMDTAKYPFRIFTISSVRDY